MTVQCHFYYYSPLHSLSLVLLLKTVPVAGFLHSDDMSRGALLFHSAVFIEVSESVNWSQSWPLCLQMVFCHIFSHPCSWDPYSMYVRHLDMVP